MSGKAGRLLRIKYDSGSGATVVAGAQTDNFTINAEGIDVTDKDDAGVRRMLPDIGTWNIEASIEGVLKDDTLLQLAANTSRASLLDFEIDVAGFGTFAGDWFLGNFEVSGSEGAEVTTFTANLMSAGAITYTSA